MIDSFSNATYLNQLNQHEFMIANEELELGRRVKNRCQKARTEFIQRNIKLVISLADRHRHRHRYRYRERGAELVARSSSDGDASLWLGLP